MSSGTGHMTKQIKILNSAWKMGSDWHITSLVHTHFCLISIFGNTLPQSKLWMNQWITEWKKSLHSGMIKNKSYFVNTYKIEQLRQQLSNVHIFDNLTNKYKQLLSAHSNQIMCKWHTFICRFNQLELTEIPIIQTMPNNAKYNPNDGSIMYFLITS